MILLKINFKKFLSKWISNRKRAKKAMSARLVTTDLVQAKSAHLTGGTEMRLWSLHS